MRARTFNMSIRNLNIKSSPAKGSALMASTLAKKKKKEKFNSNPTGGDPVRVSSRFRLKRGCVHQLCIDCGDIFTRNSNLLTYSPDTSKLDSDSGRKREECKDDTQKGRLAKFIPYFGKPSVQVYIQRCSVALVRIVMY